MNDVLKVETRDGVWRFTLNRPEKLNSLNVELVDRLLDSVDQANASGARLLIFRGEGKSFCAGFDMTGLDAQSDGDLTLRFIRIEMLLQTIAKSSAQTMGLAHGKVFGAGVDLFAVCRHRIAAPDTVFRMPGLRFGIVLGTRRFAAVVGTERARHILEETRAFGAEEAHRLGVAHKLCALYEWDDVIENVREKTTVLDEVARADLYRVLTSAGFEADLTDLVRSAARPGLKERLLSYQHSRAFKNPPSH
ncbi:enoyl-CoA hydratase/isomerase family protein [Trinickia caryophylli]|uniref:Enoyl-CoA hydratase/carnithine racemase n=1 Tax=Trinickia caryophylli TaxID=28094 RepID=A0A1X7H8S3_TRICW|nr:enoyl-CoA hydratase/isomerase family protein [Trinickia caryophylli]PMS09478.1 enoyl-CoA hydratase/isomerase family protein [Trinickia caryophylli]TRX14089.1 enoyl-CoA hydratase/isomerase family protein [Trinickia caryophylli]WQE13909.1 enoyl-CoA hydratase/isomerase family protein [Trinickia caryophylli]SMF81409.1 Enoyl-CoA hydratase/carnithine racemase [Trinickia caryophylli]GLU35748.1 enoyl-CoA hydratase [Trinickia caryophylli]